MDVMEYVKQKTQDLIQTDFSCKELKEVAQAWLNAVGTEEFACKTKAYIRELEENIVLLDDLIALAKSDAGKKLFGEEVAAHIVEHGNEIKQQGAVYCDCPACSAALAILEKKEELLALVNK